MMNRQLNANFTAFVLLAVTVVVLALLPVKIDIKPNTADASSEENVVNTAAQDEGVMVHYTLKTVIGGTPSMAFVGVGGTIDGVVNPTLEAKTGDTVEITVINGDAVLHDLAIPDFNVSTGELTAKDQQAVVTFVASKPGEFKYTCTVPGHEQIGMKGLLKITGEALVNATDAPAGGEAQTVAYEVAPAKADAASIIRSPMDVPAPVGDRAPMNIRVDLTTLEVTGVLADGTTYDYFTFDGKIPGPMIRVRVGDTVELFLKNGTDSKFDHSIDLHAVTGPGGGAVYTQTHPSEEKSFTFQAINPGLYVYHCATPSVAHHIANGMYGLILVEPKGGLPPVDREFYVMQGEIYTSAPFGTAGHMDFNYDAMLDEAPEYFVFNGAAGGLTSDDFALRANTGETVRIYFGVGGPNFTSSFHVIGEIFDRVYEQASLTATPLTDVQTTTVPPGGATMVEFKLEVPGRYILVDHALSRLERGLAAYLYVEGEDNPTVFHSEEELATAGH
jgi:nitrite reductase (NO-forming)